MSPLKRGEDNGHDLYGISLRGVRENKKKADLGVGGRPSVAFPGPGYIISKQQQVCLKLETYLRARLKGVFLRLRSPASFAHACPLSS